MADHSGLDTGLPPPSLTKEDSLVTLESLQLSIDATLPAPTVNTSCSAKSMCCDVNFGPADSLLTLSDGTTFAGYSFGADVSVSGEVVFNTGMVGYPESLTDPSYQGQILVLTYPLIGNYGVPNTEDRDEWGMLTHFESENIHIRALIVAGYTHQHSHWQAHESLSAWLKRSGIPALYGVDTRALTQHLRDHGSLAGKVEIRGQHTDIQSIAGVNLIAEVSTKEIRVLGNGSLRVTVVDCGIKNNMVRYLLQYDTTITIVPWDHDFTDTDQWDGLFVSNGPGDPTTAKATVDHLRTVIQSQTQKPVFGICMGNQLLCLAAGGSTIKMKYGNRGVNQPVVDDRTGKCIITAQNHGYCVDPTTLPPDWIPIFTNANDGSNEGICHSHRPYYSVQFHPEARAGPQDSDFLFTMFVDRMKGLPQPVTTILGGGAGRRRESIERVLLLGSGGLSIGQAGEFDYSGSQAIKAFKEEGIEVVVINPNIATVQTSEGMGYRTYLYPVTSAFVEAVIRRERPDAIALQFGGQTALNCGMHLHDTGILSRYNVRVLGTTVETIRTTEDRALFSQALATVNEHTCPSHTATTVQEAVIAGDELGYPVLLRSAFSLGGLGSGVCRNREQLQQTSERALRNSPQVIIDKALTGWKEVEYEVVRDRVGNIITVCNMENFDPLGIHTGDSIVVAPSQSLSNDDYYLLRQTALKVVGMLGVVGECNIQYALDPNSSTYYIIEVNARLSRSSALASKATGYPLAYIAAKLACGWLLPSLLNPINSVTCACFEPALDYVVVKIPRWDTRKFTRAEPSLGSSMKSVGEVMAIGGSFEEAFMKATRMAGESFIGDRFVAEYMQDKAKRDSELMHPTDRRIYAVAAALRCGESVEQIHQQTGIDEWFLHRLTHVVNVDRYMRARYREILTSRNLNHNQPTHTHKPLVITPLTHPNNTLSQDHDHNNDNDVVILEGLSAEEWRQCKKLGFSDQELGDILHCTAMQVLAARERVGVVAIVRQIDTLAAEVPARSNYLYLTYHGIHTDLQAPSEGVIVLGCGAYRIGSSCEFDWVAVNCLNTIHERGLASIVINQNPETVSTDYNQSDRLYFDELSEEVVAFVFRSEAARGVILSVGGQTPNNLALGLQDRGVAVLGTQPGMIDLAEDRSRFSTLLDRLGVDQPLWCSCSDPAQAELFAQRVGYPVIVRPSYVLSGAAMNVAWNDQQLHQTIQLAEQVGKVNAIVVSKYMQGAKEIELDGVGGGGELLCVNISEHVENAGVHSGDATLVTPATRVRTHTYSRICDIAQLLCKELHIVGPFNVQFLAKGNDVAVIECNLRASRSLPFSCKARGVNMVSIATRAMLGEHLTPRPLILPPVKPICVKAPLFSFSRMPGADPVLRVEMSATGEVAAFGDDIHTALLTAMLGAGFKLPKPGCSVILSVGPWEDKTILVESAQVLEKLGFTLVATKGTAAMLRDRHIACTETNKASQGGADDILTLIGSGKVGLVVNIPTGQGHQAEITDGYRIRRLCIDYNIPVITNTQLAVAVVGAIHKREMSRICRTDAKRTAVMSPVSPVSPSLSHTHGGPKIHVPSLPPAVEPDVDDDGETVSVGGVVVVSYEEILRTMKRY